MEAVFAGINQLISVFLFPRPSGSVHQQDVPVHSGWVPPGPAAHHLHASSPGDLPDGSSDLSGPWLPVLSLFISSAR